MPNSISPDVIKKNINDQLQESESSAHSSIAVSLQTQKEDFKATLIINGANLMPEHCQILYNL